MATVRQKRRGVWEVRVFTGTGRPRPAEPDLQDDPRRQARGDARRAGEMEVGRRPGSRRAAAPSATSSTRGSDQNLDTWAPSSARDQQSRVRGIKNDPIARLAARPSVGRRRRAVAHPAARRAGCATPASRTSTACCVPPCRWRFGGGGVTTNVASVARLRSTKATVPQRDDARRGAP